MTSRSPVNSVTADVTFFPIWEQMISPDPRGTPEEIAQENRRLIEARESVVRAVSAQSAGDLYKRISDLNARFGAVFPEPDTPAPAAEGSSVMGWKWYDARYMIATVLGAPEPEWDGGTHSWWMDRETGCPLSHVEFASEIDAIEIPDWAGVPQVQSMIESRERWRAVFPDDAAEFSNVGTLPVQAGCPRPFVGYPSFIDLGIFLLGTNRFLCELGLRSNIADALMNKCMDLATSYVDYLWGLAGTDLELLLGFAGDTACMLSPELYEAYSAAWDEQLFAYVKTQHGVDDSFPCNLHSCGPSVHLYDLWGRHPHQDHIVVMQTRLVPGTVGKLRTNMPHTVLQLTFHPQHFDVVRQDADVFREVLRTAIESAGARDVQFTTMAMAERPSDVRGLVGNLDVLEQVLSDVNGCA